MHMKKLDGEKLATFRKGGVWVPSPLALDKNKRPSLLSRGFHPSHSIVAVIEPPSVSHPTRYPANSVSCRSGLHTIKEEL
jgi:hypothetical protein